MSAHQSLRRQVCRLRATLLVLAAASWLPCLSNAAQVPLTGAVAIEAGAGHACALISNGGVQCWGYNNVGQLGDGLPQPIEEGKTRSANYVAGLLTGAAGIGVGGWHACAIMASGGGVKCWGSNGSGQLGNGVVGGFESLPVDVLGLGGAAASLSLGDAHTCAVMVDRTVKCWGAPEAVGHGVVAAQPTPTPLPGLAGVAAISAGPLHTCVTLDDGAAKCWGDNRSGQLGDGSTTSSPVAVGVASLSSGVAKISAGGTIYVPSLPHPGADLIASHTCALMTTGGLKCWGSNFDGQLGEGSTTNRSVPFDVSGLTSGVSQASLGGLQYFSSMLAGDKVDAHTCAVTSAGGLKCWGGNSRGQQGTTSSDGEMYTTPRDVPGFGSGVSAVAAGGVFTCTLMGASGAVQCFGFPFGSPTVLTGPVPQVLKLLYGVAPPVAIGSQVALNVQGGHSGNPVTFTSLTPSICSVSSSGMVDGLAQGKCRITANQAGNFYYDPAPELTIELRVGDKLPQTITFDAAPASVPVNGVGNLQATASSGLPVGFLSTTPSFCSVSGRIVTGLAVGECTLAGSQAGDDWYAPAPQVTHTFPIVANTGTLVLTVTKLGAGTGTVTSTPAGIDCGDACANNFSSGATVALAAVPSAGSTFSGWGGACSGTGACSVTMDAAKTVTSTFRTSGAFGPARLGNIATRANALTGEDTMIGGFVIGGSSNKTVAVVVTGPSLSQFGIANPLGDPTLTLVRSSDQVVIATNHNWQASSNPGDLAAAGLAPSNPLEAALLVNLPPGAYTAIVGGGTGVAVIGVYEVDGPTIPLINISTRGSVGTGDNVLIGGFVIQGSGPQTVAIVATGPSLAQHGIANPLANPKITLVRSSDQFAIAANDDWLTDPEQASLQAVGLAPSFALESGLLRTLPPGAYTVIVEGVGGATGVGVIGIYRVN